MTHLLTRALLLAPVALFAQDAAKPQPFADRYRTEAQAIDKMLADVEVADALVKLEGIIGDGKLEAFDKATPGGTYASHMRYYWGARAFFAAGRAAQGCGQWEKAVTLYKRAAEIAKENADLSKESFAKHVEDYKADINTKKGFLEGNADAIKELRAKTSLTDDDKKQLAQVKAQEDGIVTNEKWIGNFNQCVERAASEVKLISPYAGLVEDLIKGEAKSLEEYKFKNDKVKYVEGFAASKKFIEDQKAKGKDQALGFFYRLSVLDPENKKIRREIDLMLGKPVGPEPAPAKGKKK